ncbi:MAG: hypothetical protein QM800_10375 [Paludibacter sp.]
MLVITIVLALFVPNIYSEPPYKKLIYTTFINREMNKWGSIIHSIEATKPPTNVEQKLEYIDYYYGYVGHLIEIKQYDIAQTELARGQKLLNEVLRTSPQNATAYSYKGAFTGFRIGISKLKLIYLYPEISKYVYKAYELDDQNLQANIDMGNIYFYFPQLLGGNKKEAINYYLKGVKLIEQNRNTTQNWKYINLLTILAIAYDKMNMQKESKLTFEKILQKEPNCKYVKDVLYPDLLERINKTNQQNSAIY